VGHVYPNIVKYGIDVTIAQRALFSSVEAEKIEIIKKLKTIKDSLFVFIIELGWWC
jgi:hypothetical protein